MSSSGARICACYTKYDLGLVTIEMSFPIFRRPPVRNKQPGFLEWPCCHKQLMRAAMKFDPMYLIFGTRENVWHVCPNTWPLSLESGVQRVSRSVGLPSILNEAAENKLQNMMEAREPKQSSFKGVALELHARTCMIRCWTCIYPARRNHAQRRNRLPLIIAYPIPAPY